MQISDALGQTNYPRRMPVRGGALANHDVASLIDRLSAADALGIFVGAGVSIEAGLPSWGALVRRLLRGISSETDPFRMAAATASGPLDDLTEEFSSRSLAALGPLGAGAVIKAHLEASYRPRLKEALYEGVELLAPGPTAISVARFVLGAEPTRARAILTTNFDQLLETALRAELERLAEDPSAVRTVLPGTALSSEAINVVHLHGVISHPRSPAPDDSAEIIFAEDEFLAPSSMGTAARDLAESAFSEGPYLFLGASLTDTNILGDLYRHRPNSRTDRHAAIAVSQQAAMDLDPDAAQIVVDALQQTSAARLQSARVDVAFVDTYTEASQFMQELNLQRAYRRDDSSSAYTASPICWSQRAYRYEQRALSIGLLPSRGEKQKFTKLQKPIRKVLSIAVKRLERLFEQIPAFSATGEQLALHLWIHAPEEQLLSMIGQSDRRLYNPATLQTAQSRLPTDYLVVEALCNGTVVEAQDQGLRSSRWGSMVAVPFAVAEKSEAVKDVPASIPGGVLVLASTEFADAGLGRLHNRPDERTLLIASLHALGSQIGQVLMDHAPKLDPSRPDLELLAPRVFPRGRAGQSESGVRRIGPDTVVGGAPVEDIDLGRWGTVIPADLEARIQP